MKKYGIAFIFFGVSFLTVSITELFGQDSSAAASNFWHPKPANYEVRQAFEVESLVPMFFTGGYHIGVGYRYNKFRIRASVINGGSYNADNASPEGTVEDYERLYETSPGIFLGYNIWKNLELYGYYEYHTFEVNQLSTKESQEVISNDVGLGLSYQFFIGRAFYIQPGIHTYFRSEKQLTFSDGETYKLPTIEISPVIRLGVRLWKQY
jgi:hypothetical protein